MGSVYFRAGMFSGWFCKCRSYSGGPCRGLKATIKALGKVHTVGAQTVVADVFLWEARKDFLLISLQCQ